MVIIICLCPVDIIVNVVQLLLRLLNQAFSVCQLFA